MTRVTLDETWIYAGLRYGPGEVEVPNDVAAALAERGAIRTGVAQVAGAAERTPPPPAQTLAEAVGDDVAEALTAAGLGTASALAGADDDAILAVKGVGEATLRKLREFAPQRAG